MRQNPKSSVPKTGAQDELNENGGSSDSGQRAETRRASVIQLWEITLPPGTRKERQAYHGYEENLRERGVHRGGYCGMAAKNAERTKKGLRDD
jgi:hypothetical protein